MTRRLYINVAPWPVGLTEECTGQAASPEQLLFPDVTLSKLPWKEVLETFEGNSKLTHAENGKGITSKLAVDMATILGITSIETAQAAVSFT